MLAAELSPERSFQTRFFCVVFGCFFAYGRRVKSVCANKRSFFRKTLGLALYSGRFSKQRAISWERYVLAGPALKETRQHANAGISTMRIYRFDSTLNSVTEKKKKKNTRENYEKLRIYTRGYVTREICAGRIYFVRVYIRKKCSPRQLALYDLSLTLASSRNSERDEIKCLFC